MNQDGPAQGSGARCRGAVILLEKLSPALEQVDSSSGAIGSAVNRAVDALVPIIAKANVDRRHGRPGWSACGKPSGRRNSVHRVPRGRLGRMCATPELAISWADQFLPLVELVWRPENEDLDIPRRFLRAFLRCTRRVATKHCWRCWSRHRSRVARSALGREGTAAMGRKAEAVRYAEESRGLMTPAGRSRAGLVRPSAVVGTV